MFALFTAMVEAPAERMRFEEVYHQYVHQMLAVAQRILKNNSDAEDAVQNALIGIARNIDRLPTADPKVTRAYVLTAAKNAALSMLPQKQFCDNLLDIDELNVAAVDNAFETIVQSQDYQRLLSAIRQMEPIYRDILLLMYVYDHSLNETASLLQRKPETVRKQLYRGKRLLAKLYFGEDT